MSKPLEVCKCELQMMRVEMLGPTCVCKDNMSVIHNTQHQESMLKKKSKSICYHAIRESVAVGGSLTGHMSTHDNPADLATKALSGGQKHNGLIEMVSQDIGNDAEDRLRKKQRAG